MHRISCLHVFFAAALTIVALHVTPAQAWGRRGHSLVCQTAAYIAADAAHERFLKSHSYDLGYYCNVPDIIWKRGATYAKEGYHHYMDLEIFEREFKAAKVTNPQKAYEMDRLAFDKKFPKILNSAGRAWWRVREINAKLNKITEQLKDKDLSHERHQELQLQWLTMAGIVGHYVGDLGMPLHLSENHDGQLTGQKGIHHFYEETVVDDLFLQKSRGLQEDVFKKASREWKKFDKAAKGKTFFALVESLSKKSFADVSKLLKIDKKIGRKDLAKADRSYRKMIVDNMVGSALVEAEVLKRHLGWTFNEKKFYSFNETPAFVPPPTAETNKK